MSFMRFGGKGNNPPKRKKASNKRWDDTVNDLTAYKATPDEIAYRKASHQSKHAVSTHIRAPGSGRKGKRGSPFRTNSQTRKLAIMKEVLYDQKQLQEVLEKSDTMMAVVKDLFGDDPRRFEGFPTVTSAPNSQNTRKGSSLVKLHPDIQTRSEFLSDSVMDASALNDLQDTDFDIEDAPEAPLSYQPKMNMRRFQEFLEAEEKNNTLSTISGQAGMSHLGQAYVSQLGNVQSSQLPDQTGLTCKDGTFQTPKKNNPDESIEILRPPKSAINDTTKVNRTRQRVPKPQPEQNNSNFSLNDLRKVLETLEDEVAEYERQTGRRPPAERNRQESFSGYTLAIVDSVTKLTRYLKECELRLQAEMTVREQLSEDVVQFKALVDALTSDIILTQEEFHVMTSEFQKFRNETRNEIQRLKSGQSDPPRPASVTSMTSNPAEPVTMTTPPKAQQYQQHISDVSKPYSREINPFGDHLKPVSSAVMLSPPVRRSRVVEAERDIDSNKQQGPLMDPPDYMSSVDSNNSALQDEFADIPGMCVTSQAPVYNPYSAPTAQTVSAFAPLHQTQQTSQQTLQTSQAVSQTRYNVSASLNSVSVPKPTPLVQSNVGIPISSSSAAGYQNKQSESLPQSFLPKGLPVTIVPRDQPQTFQRSHDVQQKSNDTTVPSADREFLASQIADLNKQHAEAQKRLQSLMLQKEQVSQEANQYTQQQQEQQQHENQQQRQHLIENQQRLQQQQFQYDQQQKLIALVMQQQQKIQQQQQPQQQSQLPRPNIAESMINGEARNQSRNVAVRQSNELPGYRHTQKQTGLPACPVSPNISPISQRSSDFRMVYQSMDSQNMSMTASVPVSRGITVSLPTVDMDMSVGSPSPQPPQTAR